MKRFHFRLLVLLLLISCKTDSDIEGSDEPLTLISNHNLSFEGPSGLTLDVSRDFLWTVSDKSNGLVYKITTAGNIIGTLEYRGDDMEGITMNPKDGSFWVVEERLRRIVQLDDQGRVLQQVNIPVNNSNVNDGPEGIAIDPVTGHIYLVNEKIPTEFIELDEKFEVVRRVTINFSSKYRISDLSGIFYESEAREFWILSDESKRIVVTDYELNPLRSYELGKSKFEGIAVDTEIKRVYLVNDEENRLYVYSYL